MRKMMIKIVVLASSLFASYANASLVLDLYGSSATPTTVGGYEMTDFNFLEPGLSTSSVSSPLGGSLSFENISGSSIALTEGSANSIDWWVNNESVDYNTYTTDVSWIKIILPKNTLAISFNVGARYSSTDAWLTATDSSGNGFGKESFQVNNQYTPGFGIYADNSNATADNCSYLSSVIIDPDNWGVGNFSIAQGNCSVTVPEPSIVALMSFGIIGLGLARRRMK